MLGPPAGGRRGGRFHLLEVGFVWPPETFLRWKVEALAARGVRVTVACVVPDGRARPALKGVRLVRVPHWGESTRRMIAGLVGDVVRVGLRSPRSLRGAVAAARRPLDPSAPRGRAATAQRLRSFLPLARIRPDVAHFEWNSAAISFLPLAAVWACPTVVSCHGSEVNVRPHLSRGRAFAAGLRASFQAAGAVHCVSNAVAGEAARYGLPAGRACVIRPGVDPALFGPRSRGRAPRPELRIVAVGAFRWIKGHEYAIRTIGALVDRGVPARLELLGGDPHVATAEPSDRERVLHAIEALGLRDRVRLRGALAPDEVRRALEESDVLLHTSLSEGLGIAVLEAMASGLPVVITDCGGVRDAVTDGREGLIVGLRAPAEAAEALRALHDDRALAKRMGAAGRERVESEFRHAREIDGHLAVYHDLIERGEAGAPASDVAPAAERLRQDASDGPGLRLLSITGLSWTQGLEDALHATSLALERGVACTYRVAGEGDWGDALWFARHQLGLHERVAILGPPGPEQWPELMEGADVLVDLSVKDSPRAAIELARRTGLRVITTTGEHRGEGVERVPAREPETAADVIGELAGRSRANR